MKIKIKDKKHTTYIFDNVETCTHLNGDLIILFEDYTYSSISDEDIELIEPVFLDVCE